LASPIANPFRKLDIVLSVGYTDCSGINIALFDQLMGNLFTVGPQGTIHILGIKLVGFNAQNLGKLAITVVFVVGALLVSWLLQKLIRVIFSSHRHMRFIFWTRQGINIFAAFAMIVGVASVWFDDPARLATAVGLVTAGLAFALQKVVTSFAGYFVILRGRNFNVGDRIVMGGVRGDVLSLDFTQTTIMEMGQPHDVQSAEPAMWVKSRQYTGRIVTVPNSKIFDEAVYNYTREFNYIWEEMSVPISYQADRKEAETILLESARRHECSLKNLSKNEMDQLMQRYGVLEAVDLEPKVYYRLTDNWLELSVRFLTESHGVRDLKDSMSREILAAFEKAKIGIASSTFEITGLPPLQLQVSAGEEAIKETLKKAEQAPARN
jgi:small-conductance mechanosensitive channel